MAKFNIDKRRSDSKRGILLGVLICLTMLGGDCSPFIRSSKPRSTRAMESPKQNKVILIQVKNLKFFSQIANPCREGFLPDENLAFHLSQFTPSGSPHLGRNEVQTERKFQEEHCKQALHIYTALELAIQISLDNFQRLDSENPNMDATCSVDVSPGFRPITPLFPPDTPAKNALPLAYKSLLHLATHLHLMYLDRVLYGQNNRQFIDAKALPQPPFYAASELPLFQLCGAERENYPVALTNLTTSIERILCTLLSSLNSPILLTDSQRESFQEYLQSLQQTYLHHHPYQTFCKSWVTRDCLVVREAKQSLTGILEHSQDMIDQLRAQITWGNYQVCGPHGENILNLM